MDAVITLENLEVLIMKNVKTWIGHFIICQDSKPTTSPSPTVRKSQLWSSTLSPSPCLCTVKQWIINPAPPLAWSYCIPTPPWVYSPYFHSPPAGINQPITFCSLKFVMSVRRCSMFRNHSATDSINQYYHGNVGRAPLTPTLQPVEGKGNYAGSTREQEKAKAHLNIYKKEAGRVHVHSRFR